MTRASSGGHCGRTFATGPGFLVVVFFVTPAGLAAFGFAATAGFAFGLAAGFLRVMVGAVSTVWKTRGRALPVCERVPSRAIFGM